MATGKYDYFLGPLLNSVVNNVEDLNEIYVLADKPIQSKLDAKWLPWGFFEWPLSTFLRYQAFSLYAQSSNLFDCDYLVYTDVDMLFVKKFKLSEVDGLIAVTHPGYANMDYHALPYEKNMNSVFNVSPHPHAKYYAGGVQGGSSEAYLKACDYLSEKSLKSIVTNSIPVWHDESAWNHYLSMNFPAQVLSTAYCTPEKQKNEDSIILALDKDHRYFRQEKETILNKIRRKYES